MTPVPAPQDRDPDALQWARWREDHWHDEDNTVRRCAACNGTGLADDLQTDCARCFGRGRHF